MSFFPSKIVSGGQSGADRAALDFALNEGLACGGFCPKGRKAEDGTIPLHYPLTESRSSDYTVRTRQNVESSDATLVFSDGPSRGSALTVREARSAGKPCLVIEASSLRDPSLYGDTILGIERWLSEHKPAVLNVAGTRESKSPGIFTLVLDALEDLHEVVRVTPKGMEYAYREPGSTKQDELPTSLKKDKEGEYDLRVRNRNILTARGNKALTIYAVYARGGTSYGTLTALKSAEGEEHAYFVARTATFASSVLRRKGEVFDAVVVAPSSKPLAKAFADAMALRLGLPLISPVSKQRQMSKVPVAARSTRGVEDGAFKTEDVPFLNGRILVVDDFATTSSTMRAIATQLYSVDDVDDVTGIVVATS